MKKTIHQCPHCAHNIKGDYHVEGVTVLSPFSSSIPSHCEKCGTLFPWAKKNMKSQKVNNDPTYRKNKMNKIEIGTVVTVVIAIIAGAVAFGQLQGRISALETDKDYSSIREEIQAGVNLLKTESSNSINSIQDKGTKILNTLSKNENQLGNLSLKVTNLENRKLCYCIEARHNGSSCSENGGWTAYKGDGLTPDKIKIYYCD